MQTSGEFSFSDDSVAGSYDDVLVPILFEPWGNALIDAYGPWEGKRVLDLATGTGILARLLAKRVGKSGSVLGTDVNAEMLKVAAKSMEDGSHVVKFLQCPAENLECKDNFFDYVVCQQGFQFFSNKIVAAKEIRRVLRGDGTVIVSVWRTVTECDFFNTICKTLESIGEAEIAEMMRAPFEFLPKSELEEAFKLAEFSSVVVHREERDLILSGGVEHAIRAAYATPIGPKLRSLPNEIQVRFADAFAESVRDLAAGGVTMGQMASDVLVARNGQSNHESTL